MSQQGRPTTSGGGFGQPRYGIGATASPQQQARTTTTPTGNRTILDELLALGQLADFGRAGSSSAQPATRGRRRAPGEQSPPPPQNVTIIDYRDVAAPWHAPKEIVTPFDEFQNQWRSMATAAGAATATTDGGGDSTTSSSATLALPRAAPVGGAGLAILDIRRTKTNRRKRRARSGREHEAAGPPLYTGAESSESDSQREDDEEDAPADRARQEVRQNRAGPAASSQQARQQAAGQQRQQSGETLSSFESDYDLLLYLGETETEDLVETERSLDYLDQTWRQSICGGASLAPTLDESLSDVLHSNPAQAHPHQQQQQQQDDFDQLWRPASGNGGLNRRPQQQQQQQQQQPQPQQRAKVASNQNNLSPNQSAPGGGLGAHQAAQSSASLPRQSAWSDPRRAGQAAALQPAAATASGPRAHTLRPRLTSELPTPAVAALDATGQLRQQVASATDGGAGLSGALSAGSTLADTTTRELDELLARGQVRGAPRPAQMMAPPKPKRQRPCPAPDFEASPPPGGADELDRLLAEMSQSLDLDSLARYDPHRDQRQVAAARQQARDQGNPISKLTHTASSTHTPQVHASSHTTGGQNARLYENQEPLTTPASSESILSDYDGASRMLEQMISDQLAEAEATGHQRERSNTQTGGGGLPRRPQVARQTKSKSISSTRSSDADEADSRGKRQVPATCSSSVATTTTTTTLASAGRDESVAARQQAGREARQQEQEEPKYSNQSAMWRHRQAMASRQVAGPVHQSESNLPAINRLRALKHSPNYSRSLDVEVAPAGSAPSTTQQRVLGVRHESPSGGPSSRRSSTTTTTGGADHADTPPEPPAPDYADFRPPERSANSPSSLGEFANPSGHLIQVEAAEMSTSTSESEQEEKDGKNSDSPRHTKMISRMRRRTLTSMRQIRDKLGQFGGGGGATTSPAGHNKGGPVPPSEPEPPRRSSSIAGSGRGGSRSGCVEPEVGVSPEVPPVVGETGGSPRQSRRRERKGPPPTGVAQNGEQQPGGGRPPEDRKSFGRQWRERLSRSKSRFTQFIRRADSGQRKRAQSTPDERRAAAPREPISFLLAQPSDIARNERNTRESSLERHLKASLVNDVTVFPPTKLAERKLSAASSNRSLSSGDLSGLETTKTGDRRLVRPARHRSSGKRKSGASSDTKAADLTSPDQADRENAPQRAPPRRRPASLLSLKRFSESLGGKPTENQAPPRGSAEELENLESAALRAKRKRAGKRQRNRSSGARLVDGASPPSSPTHDDQLVSRKRATTDDYFGLVAPLRLTPGDDDDEPAHPVTPVSSVHQRVEMGPRVRPASVLLDGGGGGDARFAFRRDRKLPNRSQSLKSQPGEASAATRRAQGTRSEAGSHSGDQEPATGVSSATDSHHQKAVSFHNLASTSSAAPHQRRQLSPVAPNTFRPASAASQVVATPTGAEPTPAASTREISDVHFATGTPITPVQPVVRLDSPTPPVGASSSSLRTSARSPLRERGATLLGDIKSKYNELFRPPKSARSKSTDQPELPPPPPRPPTPPHRPPRRRNRKSNDDSSSAQPPEESCQFIELAPASPPLSLGPLSVTPGDSPQPETVITSRHGAQKPVKRLASFASQLRNSAVDFFNAGPNSGGQRKPPPVSPQPPATATASTIDGRPKHFATRNLDEPALPGDLAQWRPIIPNGAARNSATGGGGGVKRSASFKLPKDTNANAASDPQEGTKPDYKKGHTLAGGQLSSGQQHKSLDDSDSTWDSDSGSNRVEPSKIVQGAREHEDADESPASRERATSKRRQVCAPSGAQSAKGGGGGGGDGETSAARHASGKLPATILQKSASISSEQRAGTFDCDDDDDEDDGGEPEQKHTLKTNNGRGLKNDQNNNNAAAAATVIGADRETKALEISHTQHLANQSDELSELSRAGGKLANQLAGKEQREQRQPGEPYEGQQQPLVVCSNHWPLPRQPTAAASDPAAPANVQLFKFKDILPSPEQIREEARWRERRHQQQVAAERRAPERPAPVACTSRSREPEPNLEPKSVTARDQSAQPDDEGASNRLSVYENVDLSEHPSHSNRQTTRTNEEHQPLAQETKERQTELAEESNQRQARERTQAQETKILSEPEDAKLEASAKAMTQDDTGRGNLTTRAQPPVALGGAKAASTATRTKPAPPPRPPRDEGEWSVEEPDERLIERMSARALVAAADQQQQQPRAAAELAGSASSPSPPRQPPVAREPPKRKLISMTSIIQEPEDELMNHAVAAVAVLATTSAGEQVAGPTRSQRAPSEQARAQDPRRDSCLFERCADSDDSDSSLAPPAQSGRKRLLAKLRGQSGLSAGASEPAAAPPTRPPNLPRASGSGGGGSLVKRLARNFDQTVQDQPASLGPLGARRSPAIGGSAQPQQTQQQPPVVGANRRPPGRLSFELDEPKSDSTWYDAKSAELLDEAEVAELLREFESDGLPTGAGGPQSHSTDQFVSVANDSTLSGDDERGRRDEPRRAAGGGGGDPTGDSDDPTLNDDQTLDDDEGDARAGPLEDEEAPTESESVYASLATENSPRPGASAPGRQQSPSSSSKGKDRGELDMAALAREISPARPAARESPANSVAAAAAASDKTACNLIAACPATTATTTTTTTTATTACDERVARTTATTTMQLQEQRECITPTGAEQSDTTSGDNVACSSAREAAAADKNNINKCLRPQHPQSRPSSPPRQLVDATKDSHGRETDDDIGQLERRLERQQFKQSLNHIISHHHHQQQQQSQTQSRSLRRNRDQSRPLTSAGEQERMRVAPLSADREEVASRDPDDPTKEDEAHQAASDQQTKSKPQQKSNTCCKKASSLAKEISKCYKSLMGASEQQAARGHRQQVVAAAQPEQRREERQPPVDSVTSREQDEEQKSDLDEGGEEGEEEDFQIDTKSLVHAAKKCSQLYEELERLLQIRAAKQRKRNLEARTGVAGAAGENERVDEDDDDDEESLLADLISEQSSTRGDDVISLSSSSLSSESLPELRQRKNLQKLYNIVNEICTSEEKFVATLKLLNEDFRRHILEGRWATGAGATPCDLAHLHAHAHKVNLQQAPFDCVGLVLKHLPQLQALNESLLAELKRAREQWPSTQKISHVLVKIGPFLKHYSSYIRDFELIQAQFQENLKKSSHFRLAIHAFEVSPAANVLNAGKLSVQHHLLKPIQRIPQYRLLLQQYLHHLKPDDADYEDTVEALEVVSRVAEHANQSLSEGANFAKLLALQAKIVGKQRDIIQPGRLFVKEGELLKVCRKQIQPCWFVLLNDSLLYLKQIQSSDILYLKYELPLDDCQVDLVGESRARCPLANSAAADNTPAAQEPPAPAPGDEIGEQLKANDHQVAGELERDRQFNVCTTVRSMTLIAKSKQERDEWLAAMRAAIGDQVAKRQSFRSASSKSRLQVAAAATGGQHDDDQTAAAALLDQQMQLEQQQADASEALNELVGRKAPIWTPDARVSRCESCTSNFSALFRRHHCRACGRVVCSACSGNRAPLIYLKCRAARVCDHCFESLRANMHLYYLPSCPIDERELKRLDEHFKTLLKAQFTRERPAAHTRPHKPKAKHLKPPGISPARSPTPAGTQAQVRVAATSGADPTTQPQVQ